LNGAETADTVDIRWADGHTTRRTKVAANQVLTVIRDAP
jgi:hypothetical protein